MAAVLSATTQQTLTRQNDRLPGAVLFLCGMNAIRSPMAEALARRHFGTRIFVQSAGIRRGQADQFAIAVMDEYGIDMSKHEPRMIGDLDDDYYDLMVTLAPEAHHQALEMTRDQSVEVEYWPTMDPSTVAGTRNQIMEAYRQLRNGLDLHVRKRFGN